MIDLAKILTLAVTLALTIGNTVYAQDPGTDPFAEAGQAGGAGDPFAGGDGPDATPMDAGDAQPAADLAAGANQVRTEDSDPLIRMLQANPPKTPAEYAERLEWMVRVRRWDEVIRYLDAIKRARWSKQQLAELSTKGGSALWFKLRDATTDLPEAQRELVREIAAIPAQLARDPNWIDGWINRLAGADEPQRKLVHVQLVRAGRTAVERLSMHLLSGKSRVPGAHLVEALLKFQDDGVEALRAACSSNDAGARGRALLAIAQSPATEFGAELGTALHSELVSLQARQAIGDALLKKYSKLPEADAVRNYVHSRFQRALDEYQLLRSSPARLPRWVWRAAANGLSVQAIEAPVPDHALEALAQLAKLRAALVGATRADWTQCATALAQHAYQVNVSLPLATLSAGQEAANEPTFWKHVLDQSQNWQMHGASILAAEKLGRDLQKAVAGDPVFDFIAACLRDSRPVMRYVAVDALAKANMQTAYNGSANALEIAIEMSRLGRGPMVLVVGLSSDLRSAAQQQLAKLDAGAVTVGSTAEALQVLDQPYPIEMIMVVDRLPRNSLLTCVDRLRHSKRGASLPVAILTEEMDALERHELSHMPGVVLSLLSESPEQMPRVISELERRLDTRPLTADQRAAFAQSASGLLNTIASDRQLYGFYPLARWEKQLTDASNALPTETYLSVLGGMGTVSSQQQLAALAADHGIDAAFRTQAAVAFERSLATHGLLLNGNSIKEVYETYNEQGPTDPVTVSALGKVLDAIETKTGKGS